ncbi:unnamed protein product [Mesocestoides corti]|uniref:Uncharacterized protein n=3 Tax=Mesocestoides corti TaxID=53468 RepID=A0A0R3UR15_MESCO|nr:unnamed protein product [Mesocestoides corti]
MLQSRHPLPPIAIDFGNSFCRVAIFRSTDSQVEVLSDLHDCEGYCNRVHSHVAFARNSRLVGLSARVEAARRPKHCVFWTKRLLGRQPSEVTQLISDLCCPVSVTPDDLLQLLEMRYYPEEIAAMLMSKLRDLAEERMHCRVDAAVITVPACFNDAQREATRDAAEIAGFNQVHLLNETTALAIAYASSSSSLVPGPPRHVLFYDLGGSHVDASVVRITGSECRVLGTAGNSTLGGDDFDRRIASRLADDFARDKDRNLSKEKLAFHRLRFACERAKRSLSTQLQTTIEVRQLLPHVNYSTVLTQVEFQDMCSDLLEAAVEPVRRALQTARLSADQIDDVVLVGGSCRMPKIQSLLRDFFHQKQLNKSLHSEEAIVVGAALYAAHTAGLTSALLKVHDVLTHAIAIEQSDEISHGLIPPNTPVPCVVPVTLRTRPGAKKAQLTIRLYEGEHALVSHNRFLGSIDVQDCSPHFSVSGGGEVGGYETEVEFVVNVDGILAARHPPATSVKPLTLTKTGLSPEAKHLAKERFVRATESGAVTTQHLKERRRHLEKLIYAMRLAISPSELKHAQSDNDYVRRSCVAFFAWLSKHPRATLPDVEEKIKEVMEKHRLLLHGENLRQIWSPSLAQSFELTQVISFDTCVQTMNVPVAIDLGNNFCRAAIYRPLDARVQVIADLDGCGGGCHSIHSYVAFFNRARLVGLAARMEAMRHPDRAIVSIKSLLGRRHSEIVGKINQLSFRVTTNDSNQIILAGKYRPEEIAAVLIHKMRELTEQTVKHAIHKVVITVPPCFNDAQRQAVVDAGEIAGLRVVGLLNETTAAAIAYAAETTDEPKNILIYDLGGGHVSVAVARVRKNDVEILGTAGNLDVGGKEFTRRLTTTVAKRILKNDGVDLASDKKAFGRLMHVCDRVKRELSVSLEYQVEFTKLLRNSHFSAVVTVTEFEEMCADLFTKAMEPIDEALRTAKLTRDAVDDVVILGGSTRMRKVIVLISEMFSKKQINKSFHCEETVVHGAALYAAHLAGKNSTLMRVNDVINRTIGVELPDSILSPLILRNTPIPCVSRHAFSTSSHGQKFQLSLQLYEGDCAQPPLNNYLGSIDILDQRPVTGDVQDVSVDFKVDRSGIVKAWLVNETRSDAYKQLFIKKTGLSPETKCWVCRDFSRSLSGDVMVQQLMEKRRYLESFAYMIQASVHTSELELKEGDIEYLDRESTTILK